MSELRLRQLVFASYHREDIDRLQEVLDLGDPFADPGVGAFGLVNGVFALGDQFLEVVVPAREDTAAGRFLDRKPEAGGYMAIFQSPDIAAVRQRADAAGLRRVWNIDLPEIAASHLHPADIGGAIVSVDTPVPPESWLWGGMGWKQRAVPGGLAGATLRAKAPDQLGARWASILGTDIEPAAQGVRLPLAEGHIEILPGDRDRLSGFHLLVRDPETARARAARQGWDSRDGMTRILGVDVRLTAA
jgi:hypothetical protein